MTTPCLCINVVLGLLKTVEDLTPQYSKEKNKKKEKKRKKEQVKCDPPMKENLE